MPSPTDAPVSPPVQVAAAEGDGDATSTFEEALAYIRPHPFTNGPVVLKSGMLRCCISAILMHMGDLERERDDYRDDSLRLHREKMDRLDRALAAEAQLSAALARAERLEEALTWYVTNDDVNLCDPENQFWIDGYNRARSALTPAADPGDAADAGR